ncbi:GGDEF domain-containing protein [Paenibacillus sp. MBLB4367]|uniref:GGDEF domain-containing protein n=1 Tax=Paenibacillus sp. MBLB4367 TaxID=3384767 RepID=UPI003907FCEE
MSNSVYRESIGAAGIQDVRLPEFTSIIREQRLHSVYQPILSLIDGNVFGFEALTRGPADSTFGSPVTLFEYAKTVGQLYPLERVAREKAIRGVKLQHNKQMLFLNVSSEIIVDTHFMPGQTLELLQQHGLTPNNVVFEITERSSIEDFSLAKKVLGHYRSQGYKIAIDDAGAGYSSLQAIAELHPDFIKIDRSLISGIHRDKIKEYIVETFVTFAQKMNIYLIAEGIEELEELLKLTRMGVHYAQGYLIGRPAAGPGPIDEKLIAGIDEHRMRYPNNAMWTIGHLAAPIQQFQKNVLISEAARYFNETETAAGAVVVDGDVPVGLVNRDRLFQQLAGQYGFSLFWRKTIDYVMDAIPLIVDETLPVEEVSQMAMSREKNKLYDLVIITRHGKMAGVASIRSILEYITNVRMESARFSNPLTGLPGNTPIHSELSRRLTAAKPFCVIYADLDYFKWFNDTYGFQKGDQLIQYTADVIQHTVSVCGHPLDFVGHIGGDDFIAISASADPEKLCREIIRRFDQGVQTMYEGDIICVLDRGGNRVASSGVTLSLSLVVIDCSSSNVTLEDVSSMAATLKKKSKALEGSVYSFHYFHDPM